MRTSKCEKCGSENIEQFGEFYVCHDCEKIFTIKHESDENTEEYIECDNNSTALMEAKRRQIEKYKGEQLRCELTNRRLRGEIEKQKLNPFATQDVHTMEYTVRSNNERMAELQKIIKKLNGEISDIEN